MRNYSYWSVIRQKCRSKKISQRLVAEGVQTVGLETMQGIKSRIYESIIKRWKAVFRIQGDAHGNPPLSMSYI
jgi:hypothetical protein